MGCRVGSGGCGGAHVCAPPFTRSEEGAHALGRGGMRTRVCEMWALGWGRGVPPHSGCLPGILVGLWGGHSIWGLERETRGRSRALPQIRSAPLGPSPLRGDWRSRPLGKVMPGPCGVGWGGCTAPEQGATPSPSLPQFPFSYPPRSWVCLRGRGRSIPGSWGWGGAQSCPPPQSLGVPALPSCPPPPLPRASTANARAASSARMAAPRPTPPPTASSGR